MNSSDFDFDFDLFFEPFHLFDFPFYFPYPRWYPFGHHHPLIHIATGGGLIDKDIHKNPVHFQIRKRVKNLHADLKMGYKLNPNIDEILGRKSQFDDDSYVFDKDSYLHDFIEYAKCGFLSFDRTNLNNGNDNTYHLVAYPDFNENYPKIIGHLFDGNAIYIASMDRLNEFMGDFVKKDMPSAGVILHGAFLMMNGIKNRPLAVVASHPLNLNK